MAGNPFAGLKDYLNKKSHRTRVVLIYFILGFFFFVILPLFIVSVGSVLGFASFIGPEKYISIVYPPDKTEVPPEFNVVGISAFQIGGIIDHSPRIFDDRSKINLNIYGLRGNLAVDGKQVLSSEKSGTMHIYKLNLEEGKHTITFSTILGSQTIEVLVKRDAQPKLTEISRDRLPHVQERGKNLSCTTRMSMDRENLFAWFKNHSMTYPLKDIPAVRKGARLIYPYDNKTLAGSFSCNGDYGVAVFTERDEGSPEYRSDTRFHHFLGLLHKETLSFIDTPDSYSADLRDVKVYVTGKGALLVQNGSEHISYREGNNWKKIYVPVELSHPESTVYTSQCGSAKYDSAAARYLRSSGVTFDPCSPEFRILVYDGEPFIESGPGKELFKKKVFRIVER